MVAATWSPPAPVSLARRSFTTNIDQPLVRQSSAGRRHSIAVVAVALVAEPAVIELKSPRSLKEYEAELRVASITQASKRCARANEKSPQRADCGSYGSFLPRKLTLSRRQSSSSNLRRRSSKKDEDIAHRLEILGPIVTGMESVAADILHGFHAHVSPVAVDDGTGGVYYLRSNVQRIVGVFKPTDEEPFATNNPKDHGPEAACQVLDETTMGNNGSSDSVASGIRGGIAPGHAAIREVAAYLLDHGHCAGVPPTVFIAAKHPSFFTRDRSQRSATKVGSLQLYVPHECTADDISESLLPVEQVHAMAILDMRLANQDRHGGNVLVVASSQPQSQVDAPKQRKAYDLVPIDHGACLPRIARMDETSFLWQHWRQAKQPFSAKTTAYIASLDAIHDAHALAVQLPTAHQLESDALLTLVVCTALLQVCVLEFAMTAHSIAMLMCRQDPSEPSVLERLVAPVIMMVASDDGEPTDATSSQWKQRAGELSSLFRTSLRDHLTKPSTGHSSKVESHH